MEKNGSEWLKKCLKILPGADHVNALTSTSYNSRSVNKETIAWMLCEGLQLVYRQTSFIANLRDEVEVMKSETISCQASVIRLQQDLISEKDVQLDAIQSAVKDSVETAVIKSYSEAAQTNLTPDKSASISTLLSQQSLKSVVKHVVEEEDRNRNLMLFGLCEDKHEGEQLNRKVSAVFEELGEKPKFDAIRLGKKSTGSKTPRPVKVSLTSSASVQQLLVKARGLRQSTSHRTVFITPDRCIEERAEHKQLVQDLRQKRKEEPEKRHYLKGGVICSVDISPNVN